MRHIGRFMIGILALVASGIAFPGWLAAAGSSMTNTWTVVAPLPEGLVWPAVASAGGKLYVFGGLGPKGFLATVEAYDPQTNRWTPIGTMPEPLAGLPSATTGPDGFVYLYGIPQGKETGVMLEYDPLSNAWSHAPPPPGIDASAILVTGRDGRIYAVGGMKNNTLVGSLSAYSVHTHTWTALTPDPTPRSQPGVSVGPDGRIYVIGGDITLAKVEAYDAASNAWTSIAALPTPRSSLQAVTGPDGRIYALGGEGRCFTAPCDEVEAYDVHTKTWTSVAPMPHGRSQFVAVVGPDGRIYTLGGLMTPNGVQPDSLPTEVDAYTVVPGDQPLPAPSPGPTIATRELASLPTGRYGLGAATSGGKIYAIGGQVDLKPEPNAPTVLRTVEAYDPKTNTWAKATRLPAPRVGMGVATGPDGRIYVLGGVVTAWGQADASGFANIAGMRSVFIYNPTTRRWSKGKPMPDGRFALAAVTGRDGRIYTIGGATFCHSDDLAAVRSMPQTRSVLRPAQAAQGPPPQLPGGFCQGTNTVRAFNPRTNSWMTLAPLPVGGILPAAAVTPDGRIAVFCCGDPTSSPSSSVEVYDLARNRWTAVAAIPHRRTFGFAAAAAGDGRIDLIGGCLNNYCGSPSPVDTFDPHMNTWTTFGVTLNARQALAATTGPDGQVVAVGGGGYGNGKLLEVILRRS